MADPLDLLLARVRMTKGAYTSAAADYCSLHGIDEVVAERHAGAIAVRHVRFDGSTFDFAEPDEPGAVVAAMIEVFDADDETCVDLVAWPLNDTKSFATMFGHAEMLGVANVENPATYFAGEPLMLWRTPLRWLQEGCRGAVILRPIAAAMMLRDAPGRLAPEDTAHTREIAALFDNLDPRKRIVVRAPMEKAA